MVWKILAGAIVAAFWTLAAFAQIGGPMFPGPGIGVRPPPAATTLNTASNTSGATLTLAITVPANAAIGVCVNEFSGTDGTMADATNGAYTKVTSVADTDGTKTQMFVFYSSASLSSVTLTYTKGVSGSQTGLAAAYITNVTATDASVTKTGVSTAANPPVLSLISNATSSVNVMMLACSGGQMAASGLAFTQDGAWGSALGSVISQQANAGTQVSGASQLVSTSGSTATWAPTWSAPGVARDRGAIIIGMKP